MTFDCKFKHFKGEQCKINKVHFSYSTISIIGIDIVQMVLFIQLGFNNILKVVKILSQVKESSTEFKRNTLCLYQMIHYCAQEISSMII